MHVLAGGDSFTFMNWGDADHPMATKAAWPNYVDERESGVSPYQVTVCAEMAAGNELISRNVISAIYKRSPDAVIVGWSDPNRFETFIDHKDDPTIYEWLLNRPRLRMADTDVPGAYKGWTGTSRPGRGQSLTNYVVNGVATPGENVSWLKSGGSYGLWQYGHEELDRKMRLYQENLHNEELQYLKTIENILRVQWLCETKEIPLFNFKAWNHRLFNWKYETSELFESQINPFTWYSSTLFDFSIEKGMPGSLTNPEHPLKKYQKLFAQEVIIPWLDKL